jgi:acyl transferase domain-containing protein
MKSTDQHDPAETIAIVGMACRVPGAKNIDQFWQNLRDGVESISFFSDEEVEQAGIDPAELKNPNYVKAGGILDDVEYFDADFFGFTPKEAEMTDPQHRLFLECCWESLEHAGYSADTYPGLIGLYGGAGANTYLVYNLASAGYLRDSDLIGATFIYNKNDHLTGRVAYKLNLRGPSVTVQTACSTSLVAVSMACQSLLNYEVDMALAGGVTIMASQKIGYMYREGGINSPDGHCRAFDARARGAVSGNGAGVVVLKRLKDALADGDNIWSIIRGSATNNDGSLKVGYTAPSVESQTEVIALAQGLAGVSPETISYVEAHGTGTTLGDPIEVAALTSAFRAHTNDKGFCAIGSVKTGIGHLDTASASCCITGRFHRVFISRYPTRSSISITRRSLSTRHCVRGSVETRRSEQVSVLSASAARTRMSCSRNLRLALPQDDQDPGNCWRCPQRQLTRWIPVAPISSNS